MWLLQEEVASAIAQALRAGLSPSAEARAEFISQRELEARDGNVSERTLKVAGDVAEINIEGTLTPKPDLLAMLFGGGNTTYSDITAALARAQADPAIKRVVLNVNSPGGIMEGLFDALAALEAFPKPIRVVASKATSAAYALAALAGPIEAKNAAAEFGSIGVATKFLLDPDAVELTNTESPKKRPDLRTDEGKASVREYLDAVFDLFVEAIARGRGVSADTVTETFGRGATVLAGDAKRLGMIDKIAKPALRPVGEDRRARALNGAVEPMDLNAFKTQHPELYAAVVAEGRAQAVPSVALLPHVAPVTNAPPSGAGQEKPMDLKALKAQHAEAYEAAVREGELKERDRVTAHLNMGEKCGDMSIALKAIKAGDGMTLTLTSEYMCAGMNRSDRAARQTETEAAGRVLDGAAGAPEAKTMGDLVADAVERELGKAKAS